MSLDEARGNLDSALHLLRADGAAEKLQSHPKTRQKHHVHTNFTMKTIDSGLADVTNRSGVADLILYKFFRSEKHC